MTELSPVFILAPPRGLGAHLAAALGKHPAFANLPAIHLMCGDTPADLAARWGDRLADHDHGLLRAVSGLITGDSKAADWLAKRHDKDSSQIFRSLAKAAAPRALVDASFLYAVDDMAMERIARRFPAARFIHFLRHPAAGFTNPEQVRARAEALWLRPHLRIHAFLAGQPVLSWLRLRAEWLAADPAPRLAALLDWLAVPHDATTLATMLDPGVLPDFASHGPASAPHGVDPALVADPGLKSLFGAPRAPELDDDAWEAAGFDAETRAMARLFGYR
jgi:hypothetical protein